MKFDHLRASIVNNSDQTPNIYMALCMVESLFLDMESESGKEINRCPAGDELLPSKLIWLCRTINEIYEDHDEELQRNRARLDAAVGKLKDTQDKLESLSSITKQMEALKEEYAALEQNLKARNAVAQKCEELRAQCAVAKQKLEALSRFDPADAKRELEKLSNSITEQEAARAALLKEVEQKRAELEQIKKEQGNLFACSNSVKAEREALENEHNQLIIEIAHKKKENETYDEKMRVSQKKLEQLRQEKTQLNAAVSACLQELGSLQSEVEQLEKRKLPEVRELRDQEQKGMEELQQSVEQIQAQYNLYKAEVDKLKEKLPTLEEAVKNERVVYDALTASCIANSKELESLERQNAELRNNKNEEKLVIYRKQLEENQQKLEQIRRECDQIERENAQKQKQLEEGQNTRAKLLDLKQRHESGIEVTTRQLQELAFVGTDNFVREVIALEERMKLLERVREKLAVSIANMHQYLGHAPIEEHVSLEKQLRNELRDLQRRTEDLRGTIVDCAKSIKLEVR